MIKGPSLLQSTSPQKATKQEILHIGAMKALVPKVKFRGTKKEELKGYQTWRMLTFSSSSKQALGASFVEKAECSLGKTIWVWTPIPPFSNGVILQSYLANLIILTHIWSEDSQVVRKYCFSSPYPHSSPCLGFILLKASPKSRSPLSANLEIEKPMAITTWPQSPLAFQHWTAQGKATETWNFWCQTSAC